MKTEKTCIFEYCNYGKGYLRVVIPAYKTGDKTNPSREIMTDLDDFLVEDGVIKNAEAAADRIKRESGIEKFPPATLLLRCEETYKTILSLPTMSRFKADALYARERKQEKTNDACVTATNGFHHSLGYVFNTYRMPKPVVDSFKKTAKLLGTKIALAEPFGFHLMRALPYEGNFVFFHIRRKVCTMILAVDRELVSVYDFEYADETDIRNQFLLVISKHEFEFERKSIQRFGIDSDEKIELDLGLSYIREPKETRC